MVMKLVQMEGLWSDWMNEIEIELEEKKLGEDSERQEIELSKQEEEKLDYVEGLLLEEDGSGRMKGTIWKGREVWSYEISEGVERLDFVFWNYFLVQILKIMGSLKIAKLWCS